MISRLLVLLLLVLALASCKPRVVQLADEAPLLSVRLTDDRGEELVFPRAPRRLLVLDPGLAEILAELGQADRILALGDNPLMGSDTLPGVRVLATQPLIDYQMLLELQPDAILLTAEHYDANIQGYSTQYGVPLYYQRYDSIEDIQNAITRLGTLTNSQERAAELRAQFSTFFTALQAETAELRPTPTAFLFGYGTLQTVGNAHLIDELMTLAGAQNILGYADSLIYAANPDSLIAGRPEYVILAELDPQYALNLRSAFPDLETTPAYVEGGVVQVNPSLFFYPGLASTLAAAELLRIVHPQVNADSLFNAAAQAGR